MTERKPIGQKLRFEVFKRDKFTCQYCGAKAPDVVLQADHIQPVAEGGATELLNLITSCAGCNSGKGARLLSDDSVVERQRKQIEDLEERRQQLEMMLRWREELLNLDDATVQSIADHIAARSGMGPNEAGRGDIRRWLKRYTVNEVLAAIDEAFTVYLKHVGDKVDEESWEKAFAKIPGVAGMTKQMVERPYMRDLFYIQGIVRNRTKWRRYTCVDFLEEAHLAGASIEELSRIAKRSDTPEEFEDGVNGLVAYLEEKSR